MHPSPERTRPGRSPARRQILLFTAARDWHARELKAALEGSGAQVTAMPLERCAFDTTARFGLLFGRSSVLPDGVLVRSVSAGSFEAVTRRLGVLRALQGLGVPVWNEAGAIERCVDKSMTTFLLDRAGLPVPQSWAVEGLEAAQAVVNAAGGGGPLVLKPLFGSQGRGILLVRQAADLPPPVEVAGVYYLQRFIGGPGPEFRDYRVFVIAGEPVAAMARHGTSWITNVKQGGRPVAVPLDRELQDIAGRACDALGAAFCGVDVIREPDGALSVLEVNSMPAWSGLQTVTKLDIAAALAAAFLRCLAGRRERKVA